VKSFQLSRTCADSLRWRASAGFGEFHAAEEEGREEEVAVEHVFGKGKRGGVAGDEAGRSSGVGNAVASEPNFEIREEEKQHRRTDGGGSNWKERCSTTEGETEGDGGSKADVFEIVGTEIVIWIDEGLQEHVANGEGGEGDEEGGPLALKISAAEEADGADGGEIPPMWRKTRGGGAEDESGDGEEAGF
jgi:hypothetical protein